MNRVRREPVATGGAILILINALMVLSNAMQWYSFDVAQMAAVNGVAAAVASIIVRGTVFAPIDADGDDVTTVKVGGA